MPDIWIIVLRSVLAFTVLLLLTRAMGKQVISQLTFFEFVVGITIGDIAASLAMDHDTISFGEGLAAMLTFAGITIALSALKLRWKTFSDVIDGTPTQIIADGRFLLENMRRERLSVDDAWTQLRLQQIFDLAEVEAAYLEVNGQVSVKKRASAQSGKAAGTGNLKAGSQVRPGPGGGSPAKSDRA